MVRKLTESQRDQRVERVAAGYERIRIRFAQDFRDLMAEHGVDENDIADRLGISPLDFRVMLYETNLKFSDVVNLVDALGGTLNPLMVIPMPLTEHRKGAQI